MFQEKLKQYVSDNPKLVTMKPAGENMFVLKYRKSVFYDNLWDDFLEHCRGTIVDKDFNLVTYPFQKIYNYGIEAKAPVLSDATVVTSYRKVNGFMVAITCHRGKLLISTTGSTENDYVEYAKEMMETHSSFSDWEMTLCNSECQDMTFMFECVHPSDPHIVVEKPGMYLLGYREKTWDSKVGHNYDVMRDLAAELKCFLPERIHITMLELKEEAKKCQHEGFVAYTDDGQSFKIKSPYYLTNKWVARNPRTDKLMTEDFRKQIDEEYYPLLSAIRENIEAYTLMTEQERLGWIRKFLA